MRGFVLTPTHRVVDGVPEVHLYGVLENGEPCLIIDDRQRPHFFIDAAHAETVGKVAPAAQVEPTELHSFGGDNVARVTLANPGEVPGLRRRLEARGIPCHEADVRFAYRYLIDRGIRGAFEVHGHSMPQGRLGRVLRNPELQPAVWAPKLKVLSIDIETARDGALIAIGMHMGDLQHAILVHEGSTYERSEPVHSPKAAVRRFLEYLHVLDPDVITGWNVVDFDLAHLLQVARTHGVKFAIGRNDDELDLQRDASYTRESRAIVCGRLVLDGLSLMRGAFIRLEDYKLETAAQTFLGEGKLIKGDGRHHEIERLYREAPQKLIDYNLQDCVLVSRLLEQTGLVDLAIQRSLLTGMPLDRVSASIASIDSLYLGVLRGRGLVAPSVHADRSAVELGGGYVMESKPGLFRNVLVFDFKSLYPSIIRTFNIDPMTLVAEVDAARTPAVEAPNGARFRRDVQGVIPQLMEELSAERDAAKRSGDGVKSNAIKILMNSFYGVLGASASRLFSPAVANAITSFGQHLIRFAAAEARRAGFEVIYGDTDSLFIDPHETDPHQALKRAEQLRETISQALAAHVQADYACDSVLDLEFEKLYLRFFLPEVRGGKVGSKKRYAGLLVGRDGQEEIEFVGLESVRRDWSPVSKHFQRRLLELVFHDELVEEFIRTFVGNLRAGLFDDQLAYKKAIRKNIDSYTKTTPPHIKAARKLIDGAGRIIEYVMTHNGPEPVDQLTAKPDYDHYVMHQLAPIADAVLRFFGTSFEAIVDPPRQLSLF